MRTHFALLTVVAACACLCVPARADEIPAAPAVPVAPAVAATPVEAPPAVARPDSALLVPLLDALAAPAEHRPERWKQVAASADPRAVAALRYAALHDNNPAVREAAILLLQQVAEPSAVQALVDIATGVENLRPQRGALDALSRHVRKEGVDALYRIAANLDGDMETRKAAVETLGRDHPQVLTDRGLPQLGGSAVLSTLGGGFFGGWALSSVGDFAGTRSAGAIGWVAGSVVGAGSGYIFGRQISTARQHYYLSALSWGSWAGWLSADAIIHRPVNPNTGERISEHESGVERIRAGLSLAGELAGLGLAVLGADALNLSSQDVVTVDVVGVSAAVATAGALALATPQEDQRPGYATLLAGSLAGLGIGVLTAPAMRFSSGDVALTAYGAAEGAYYGGFLASVFRPDRPEYGGMGLGGGLGLLGGMAIAQHSAMTVGNVFEVALMASYGKALGGGIALLANQDNDNGKLVHLATGAAGMLAGVWLSDVTEYRGGDRAIVPISTLLGLWHGAWLGVLANDHQWSSDRSNLMLGMTLVGGSLFGLGGVALSQQTQWNNWQTTMGSSGAVWGAWFAGWTLALENDTSDTASAGRMLLLTDLGLATTALLMSPVVDADPRVLAGANFGGLCGAGLAALFTAMFTTDSDAIIKANLGGSAVGLALGGLLARVAISDDKPVKAARQGSGGGAWKLPGWVRWPFDAVMAAPHAGADGKLSGVVVQGVAVF
ncbi:MAG: HEAT repeat domain-containing protein [Deltaproteobacteria bacterium]|nr:HEAT repeat domain-containing protein [Deltaproteobacteria bacterium]